MTDPILLELYRHRFSGVAEDMGVTLRRTAYSPNIKERLDYSCAVFDAAGRMVAQAAHIPVHLGAMPRSVEAALEAVEEWRPGDLVLLNDPFRGGTHLPDITMIAPVFVDDAPAFFTASRAHHADVGGMTPGSLPLSTEIYQEGIVIPPVKLVREGVVNEDLLRLLLRNVRTPQERQGDLAAQRSAHAVGGRRLHDLAVRHGRDEVAAYADHLLAYSEVLLREAIARWPDGAVTFRDYLELPGNPYVHVTATIRGDEVTFDFTETSPSVEGSLNAVRAITESACMYAVRCLAGGTDTARGGTAGNDAPGGMGGGAVNNTDGAGDIPVNAGCFRPVHVRTRQGTLVDAAPPSAVAGGNVETSQRIVDVVLGALAQVMPDRVPAASQGTMNNLTIGGTTADGSPYAYYETIGGGMGASKDADGLDGVHVHMTNTLNTPVEALEMAFPFRVEAYELRRGSGGGGIHRGGDGIVRSYRLLQPATATVLSERRARAPWGLSGGAPGRPGRNTLVHGDVEEALPSKFSRRLDPGDVLRIETPGGGGWGARG